MATKPPCTHEGCTSKEAKDGLCYKHYRIQFGVPPWGQSKKTPGGGLGSPSGAAVKKARKQGTACHAPTKDKQAGPVPEAALMGAIRKYAMDGVRAEVLPVIERIEKDLAELKGKMKAFLMQIRSAFKCLLKRTADTTSPSPSLVRRGFAENLCCRYVKPMTHITGRNIIFLNINYCPTCGRRLKR